MGSGDRCDIAQGCVHRRSRARVRIRLERPDRGHSGALPDRGRPRGRPWPEAEVDGEASQTGSAELIMTGGDRLEVPLVGLSELRSAASLPGPALIAARFGSITVWPGQVASIDADGNVVLRDGVSERRARLDAARGGPARHARDRRGDALRPDALGPLARAARGGRPLVCDHRRVAARRSPRVTTSRCTSA